MAGFLAASIACAADAPLSCHNTSSFDTCCLNFPGGDLVQTQFWDTNPASGPADSWTIHGLWSVRTWLVTTDRFTTSPLE